MKEILPQNLLNLAADCPFPLYVVGGLVRDYIASFDSERKDIDICAPADCERFAYFAGNAGFKIDAVYKNTGTIKLSCGEEGYEFTSFRSDEYVRGGHRPVKTFFTDDMLLDAKRRDFKCNAIYYDVKADGFCDPLGGIDDIKNRRLTTVADADKVFGEDGLRLMRLARISAQTRFRPTEECLNGAKRNASLITDIAPERIYRELDMILHADSKYSDFRYAAGPYAGLRILKETGVLALILPELAAGDKMEQRSDFHSFDVLEHSLRAVMYAPAEIRLAALLHDVGKPFCKLRDGNFHAHDTEGERIARDICARLKVSKKLTEEVAALTRLHMYDLRCDAKESKVRRFIVKNYVYFDKLMLLKQADFSACKCDLSTAPAVIKMTGILNKMREEGVPLTLKQLEVKGDELIVAGCPPRLVGETLERLLSDCAAGQVENNREKLLNYAQKVAFGAQI